MRISAAFLALGATMVVTNALAADVENGRRLAQARCTPCHIVVNTPGQREELANSPPFSAIARKSGFAPEMLAYLILAPHPRMGMMVTRSEADDIATYIATLGQ